ncbi:MAG: protein translocase subunit SecF, partial [Acidothermales bacterium]|nr:protein translocase subunit SecF [Acidothermales bacterium]
MTTPAGSLGTRLYRGEVSIDFVGRQRRWYAISGLILLIAVLAIALKGLSLGVEFRGGAEFLVPTTGTVAQAQEVLAETAVGGEPIVQSVGEGRLRVQTSSLTQQQANDVQDALASRFGLQPNDIQTQRIGPSWGGEITRKAFTGLAVFILLVVLYLSLAFEWKMAVSAVVALIHDLVITAGIYALVGFEVTPATVIGLLTILGYSLYDTVVIFDKVKENTAGLAGSSRMSYSQAANLALNQTLVRSINTSLIALLPVAALLFFGAGALGVGPLKDLALVLFVGIAVGTFSSVFIATPLLANLKEREPQLQALARRAAARQGGGKPVPATVGAGAAGAGGATSMTARGRSAEPRTGSGATSMTRRGRSAGPPTGSGATAVGYTAPPLQEPADQAAEPNGFDGDDGTPDVPTGGSTGA